MLAASLAAGAVATAATLTAVSAPAAAAEPSCSWQDTTASSATRAQRLLKASSLQQKLRWLDEQAANNPAQTTFNGVTYPAQVPCTPTVVYADGPDYVRGPAGVTVFPAQLALASSFDRALARDKGTAQGDEAFRSGKNGLLAPGIASGRTPLSGRTTDYLGEDPLLSGTMAAAHIRGIEKGNPDEPVMAVVKHYVANEQELDRQTSSSNIDGRTLREVYHLPFEIAVKQGSPSGVMCSYNQVNGVYACENPILNNLLRGEAGFDGYVVSDFGSVHSTGPSLVAGLDQELNRPRFYSPANIEAALDNGTVTVAQIDAAAFRVVRAYIDAGLFDHPLPTTPSTSASTEANRAVAQRIAERGSVLLKNADRTLPLGTKNSSVAVIGPTASAAPTGGVSAATVCAMKNFGPATACPGVVAPLDALTARAAQAGASVIFDDGSDLASAARTAAAADVAVVFGYSIQGEGTDKTSLGLDGNGEKLIDAVAAANPKTVVVLETGTATVMPWLDDVAAVVQAWYPGQQQGTALARLLYGDVNFSGRLPMTFPKSVADLPTAGEARYPGLVNGSATRPDGDRTSIRQVDYSEGLAVGYKWYQSKNIEPLFPFGYGLSYGEARYRNLQITPAVRNNPKRKITVRVQVSNPGTRTLTETPQVYVTLPSSTGEPGSRLVGYQKVTLRPGQKRTVTFTVDPGAANRPLSYWSTAQHAWTTDTGSYGVRVGSSSADGIGASFTIAR